MPLCILEFSKADTESKRKALETLDNVLADAVIKSSGEKNGNRMKDYNDAIQDVDISALFKFLQPFLPIIQKIVEDYPDEVAKTLTCLKPLLGKLMGEFLGGGGKGGGSLLGLMGGLFGEGGTGASDGGAADVTEAAGSGEGASEDVAAGAGAGDQIKKTRGVIKRRKAPKQNSRYPKVP